MPRSSGQREIFQLSYISRSVIDPEPEILRASLRDIVTRANRFNADHEITGTLCYTGGQFCQVLEGEPLSVEALFERIQSDKRHVNCRLITYHPIEKRMFPKWSMKFAGAGAMKSGEIDGILSSQAQLRTNREGSAVVEKLLKRLQWYAKYDTGQY